MNGSIAMKGAKELEAQLVAILETGGKATQIMRKAAREAVKPWQETAKALAPVAAEGHMRSSKRRGKYFDPPGGLRDSIAIAARVPKSGNVLEVGLKVGSKKIREEVEAFGTTFVITRKTNGCNRNRSGAATHAILSSVLVTCHQHAIPILDYLVQLQRFGGNPPPLVSAIPLQLEVPSSLNVQR